MHPRVGRTLGVQGTASDDPIYWSFHAYIDLIWARWQRLHRQEFGAPNATLWLEPKTWKVSDKVTTTDWGYEYEYDFGPDGRPPPPAAVASMPSRSRSLSIERESTNSIATAQVEPQPAAAEKFLRIRRVVTLPNATYRMLVYVHPVGVEIANMPDGRSAYLAKQFTIWAHGGHAGHHQPASDVIVSLDAAISKLQGSPWRITILTEPVTIAGTERDSAVAAARAAPARTLFESLDLQER